MKKYLPKEHGAWLIFFIPALCGIFAVSGGELSSPIAALSYFCFIFIGFILTKPLTAFSSNKESLRDYFDGVLLLFFLLTIASYFLIEAGRLEILLVILSPLFVFFFLATLLVKPSQSSVLKRMSGILFPLSAIGGYYAHHGVVDLNAYLIYLINVLFFFPRSTLASEFFIQKKKHFWGKSAILHVFSIVFLFFLYLSGIINIKIIVMYVLFAVPVFLTLGGILKWENIRTFGKVELYVSFLFFILLTLLY